MKRLLNLAMIPLLLLATSCTKEEITNEIQNHNKDENIYTKVGKYHGEGMDFYIQEFSKELNNAKISKINIDKQWFNNTSTEIFSRYCEKNEILTNEKSLKNKQYLNTCIQYFNNSIYHKKENQNLLSIIENSTLSEKAISTLLSMESIIEEVTLENSEETIILLDNKMQEARNELISNEYEIVALGEHVAINSILYSTNNFEKWKQLLGIEDKMNGPDYGQIGKADFTGAVGGGLGGAALGGVGAGPGALVGGLGASTGELMWQAGDALGKYFGWW